MSIDRDDCGDPQTQLDRMIKEFRDAQSRRAQLRPLPKPNGPDIEIEVAPEDESTADRISGIAVKRLSRSSQE